MEAVKAFQSEMSSLYEMKPPVSKAKMAMITKSAVKAIKFYKHVVQSVEKFIQKCKTDFKVPGLYVVDSIVRQSRHQFGSEKDVFGPRFLKNICNTFQHLLKCPKDDLEKIRRVLVLWQKNSVFPSDVLQSLLDWVADPSNHALMEKTKQIVSSHTGQLNTSKSSGKNEHSEPYQPGDGDTLEINVDDQDSQVSSSGSEVVAKVTKLLLHIQKSLQSGPQTNVFSDLERLQELIAKHGNLLSGLDASLVNQIRTVISSLMEVARNQPDSDAAGQSSSAKIKRSDSDKKSHPKAEKKDHSEGNATAAGFNKKLLEYDYGDSEEDTNGSVGMDISEDDDCQDSSRATSRASVLAQPDLLQRIEEISKTLQRTEKLGRLQQQQQQQQLLQQQQLSKLQNPAGQMQAAPMPFPPPALPPPLIGPPQHFVPFPPLNSNFAPPHQPPPLLPGPGMGRPPYPYAQALPPPLAPNTLPPPLLGPDSNQKSNNRTSSSSAARTSRLSHRSRRSRSRSNSSRSRSRSRSRSSDRRRSSHRRSRSRSSSRERRQRNERERRKRGLPPMRESCVSIASCTIWVGHLSKHTRESELRQQCEEATGGQVVSINLIIPRGCAYVTFTERRDAKLAIDELQGVKIQGFAARVEWAQGNGVKGEEFKEAWDKKEGVTYIPWEQLGEFDLLRLSEGGVVDEDTLPEGVREKFMADYEKMQEEKRLAEELAEERARVEAQERAMAVGSRRSTDEEPLEDLFGGSKGPNRFSGGGRGRGGANRGARGGWAGRGGGGADNNNRFNNDRGRFSLNNSADAGSAPSLSNEEPPQIRLQAELPVILNTPAAIPQPVAAPVAALQPNGIPGLPGFQFAAQGQPGLLPLLAQPGVPGQPQAIFGARLQLPPQALVQQQQQQQQQQQPSPANTRPTGPGLLAVQQAIAAGSLSAEQQQTILGEKTDNRSAENRPSSIESFIQQQQLQQQQLQQQQQQILVPQASGPPILLRLPSSGAPMSVPGNAAALQQHLAAMQQHQQQQQQHPGLPVIDVVSAMNQLRQQSEQRQQLQQHQHQQILQQQQVQQLLQQVQRQQQQEGQLNLLRFGLQQQLQQQQQQQQQQLQQLQQQQLQLQQQDRPQTEDDEDAEAEEALRQMMEEEEAAQESGQQQPPQIGRLDQDQMPQQPQQQGAGLIAWPPPASISQRQTDSPNSSSSSTSNQPQFPAGVQLPPGFPQLALQGFGGQGQAQFPRGAFAGSPLIGLPMGAERLQLPPGVQLPPGMQLQLQAGGGGLFLRPGFPNGGAGAAVANMPQRMVGPPQGNPQLNQLLAAFRAGPPTAQPGPGLFLRPGLPMNFAGAQNVAALRGMLPPQFADLQQHGFTLNPNAGANNPNNNGDNPGA